MGNLEAAFAEAELLAQRATERARNAPLGLSASGLGIERVDEDGTVPCFDPWLIVKSEPNRERAARRSLMREGFECWYPAGRKLKALPRRFISSKTRHKKRHIVIEDLRLPYPGYMFLRRLSERSHRAVLGRLWELDGVLGVCMFGEQIAIAEHYEIQMMRFKEDIGSYDEWSINLNAKEFKLAEIRRTEAVKERWEKPPKVIGSLDTNRHGSLHLVEAFGRITRVISATGDLTIRR